MLSAGPCSTTTLAEMQSNNVINRNVFGILPIHTMCYNPLVLLSHWDSQYRYDDMDTDSATNTDRLVLGHFPQDNGSHLYMFLYMSAAVYRYHRSLNMLVRILSKL